MSEILTCSQSNGSTYSATLVVEFEDHMIVEKADGTWLLRDGKVTRPPMKKDDGSTIMPFGKYRGQPVSIIPLDYAQWAMENVTWKTKALREAFEKRVKDAN